MKVTEQGVGEVSLNKKDFVASGGEGSVYAKGSTAYKIYTNPKKMIPLAKIHELSAIDDPKVIRPLNVLLSNRNSMVGYTMRYIKNTSALCQLFTKSFKDRNNITPEMSLDLIRGMQDTVCRVHNKNISIVDLNEMNFLVDSNFKEVYFIDVDSYQTKSYQATAIMESIRDRHAKKYDQNSDWFSFAVVAFQLFIGIHPYKGKYSKCKMSFEDRMLKNISVFNPDVSVPKVCPSFDIIPQVYKNWFFKIFEEGYRGLPPFDLNAKINVVTDIKTVSGDDIVEITEINVYKDDIIDYYSYGLKSVFKLKDNSVGVDNSCWGNQGLPNKKFRSVGITTKSNQVIESFVKDDDLLYHYNLTHRQEIYNGSGVTKVKDMMTYNGRVYIFSESNILEIQYIETKNILVSNKVVGQVLEKATKMYDGVVIQNLFGFFYASIFPESGTCFQIRLEELNDYKIVDAKFDNKVLVVIANKKGIYDKFIYRLNGTFDSYDLRKIENISIIDINFVCLDNGVIVRIDEKENLELSTIANSSAKVFESDVISADMKLCKKGNQVLFTKENILYTLKTK